MICSLGGVFERNLKGDSGANVIKHSRSIFAACVLSEHFPPVLSL